MNKAELLSAVSDRAGTTKKDAEKVINAFTDVVANELKRGGKVQVAGFGIFEVTKRAARVGVNPSTHEAINIAASCNAKFKASKALKDLLNS